jgi:ribosomal protein L35
MPKLKTRKSLVKRLKYKNGKIKRSAPNKSHFRSVKRGEERRANRRDQTMSREITKKVKDYFITVK